MVLVEEVVVHMIVDYTLLRSCKAMIAPET